MNKMLRKSLVTTLALLMLPFGAMQSDAVLAKKRREAANRFEKSHCPYW
ncbi:hypothetical protein [Paenibacillus alvei]|nr:hypothetical protein [Paenibacillus alvei]